MGKADASGEVNENLFTKIVGAKFKPTDSILVDHYLVGKVCGCTDGPVFQFIKDVDVYECEPEQLSRYEPYDFRDNPRKNYFFTTLKMIKTKEGRNVNRSVADGGGLWKITGKFIDVSKDGIKIGTKTSLAYYKNGQKTNWLMTEYRLSDKKYEMLKPVDEETKRLALCIVYHNGKKRGKCESGNELGAEKVDHQSSKQQVVTSAKSSLTFPDATQSSIPYFLCSDSLLEAILTDENLGNTSCSDNIPVGYPQENIPISGMGSNSQSVAYEPVVNHQNWETDSAPAPWSSLSSAQNSYLNCPKNLIISFAGNPSVASGSSSMFNLSSNLHEIHESPFSNHIPMQSHWNPHDYEDILESLFGHVACNNTVTEHLQDDQGPVSTVQISNDHCQNDLVMGYYRGGNLNHNLPQSSSYFEELLQGVL